MKKTVKFACVIFFSALISTIGSAQKNQKSLQFDGINDNVVIPDHSAYKDLTQLTISTWVKFNNIPDWKGNKGGIGILTKLEHRSTGANSSFNLFTEFDENHLRFDIKFVDGTLFPLSYDSFWDNVDTSKWYNITGVSNGSKSKLYINGGLVHTTANSRTDTIQNTNFPLEISSDFGRLDPLNGYISSTSLWNVALTQSDINKYMCDLPNGNETGLIGLWNMEEGSGIAIYDSSSVSNNGTLYSGTSWSNLIPPNCDTCFVTINIYDTITHVDTVKYYDTVITRYSVTDTLIIDIPLSYGQNPNLGQIKMFPNPANEFIIFQNSNPSNLQSYNLEIVSSVGSLVYTGKLSKNEEKIQVDKFGSKGTFQVIIRNSLGTIIDTRILIIN